MLGIFEALFLILAVFGLYMYYATPKWYKSRKKREFVSDHGGRSASKDLDKIGIKLIKANNLSHLNL